MLASDHGKGDVNKRPCFYAFKVLVHTSKRALQALLKLAAFLYGSTSPSRPMA